MHEKSISLLNRAIADELYAIHQYMYFHFQCGNHNLNKLADHFKKNSIDEMRHMEKIAERVLFLGGDVVIKSSHEVEQIHNIKEMLAKAISMEEAAIKDYNRFAKECFNAEDMVSKNIFEELVGDEEGHLDFFQKTLEKLESLGSNYMTIEFL